MKQEDVTRKCIVTSKVLDKALLLRFTVTPDHLIVPDFKKKLPGKGIYVTNSMAVLEKAVAKNAFAKPTQGKAKPMPGLVQVVRDLLHRRALEAFSLAKKAGVLILGMDKVIEAVKKGKVAFVLEAENAGSDGHQRIALAAKEVKILRLFTTEELDTALNKSNTVYAAFEKGEMAQMVRNEFEKFANFLDSSANENNGE